MVAQRRPDTRAGMSTEAPPGLLARVVAALPVALRPHVGRAASGAAFVGGFAFDAFTLDRPDDPLDMGLLVVYLVLAAALVVVEQRARVGRALPAVLAARLSWVHLGAQFLVGGLLSGTVVLYARSGGWDRTLLAVMGLFALMVVVEVAEEVVRAELPRLALLGLVAFAAALLFLPVVTGYAGPRGPLLLAAAAGAQTVVLVVVLGVHGDGPAGALRRRTLRALAGGVGGLVLMGALEATRVLPPVPLAVMEAAIVRDVDASGGRYTLTSAAPPWWAPWRDDDRPFRQRPGDAVWCFTSVFAPTGMTTAVHHVWERRDEDGAWVETDRIPYPMRGGRGGGWRGYTRKRHVPPGDWRVRVVSDGGRELTRIPFTVVATDRDLDLRTRVVE